MRRAAFAARTVNDEPETVALLLAGVLVVGARLTAPITALDADSAGLVSNRIGPGCISTARVPDVNAEHRTLNSFVPGRGAVNWRMNWTAVLIARDERGPALFPSSGVDRHAPQVVLVPAGSSDAS